MAQTLMCSAVAAALLSGRCLPALVEWGVWGAYEAARGAHWVMYGQRAEDARLRRIVREMVAVELAAQRGELPANDPRRHNTPMRRCHQPKHPTELEG